LQPEAAHRIGAVGDVRLAAGQREAPDHGHAAGLEDNRLRETHSIPVAGEKSGNAYAFGMVATKAGMDAVDALERVGESGRRQIVRSEPAAEIVKAPATTTRATPISASRATVLAMLRGRRSVCTGASR